MKPDLSLIRKTKHLIFASLLAFNAVALSAKVEKKSMDIDIEKELSRIDNTSSKKGMTTKTKVMGAIAFAGVVSAVYNVKHVYYIRELEKACVELGKSIEKNTQ